MELPKRNTQATRVSASSHFFWLMQHFANRCCAFGSHLCGSNRVFNRINRRMKRSYIWHHKNIIRYSRNWEAIAAIVILFILACRNTWGPMVDTLASANLHNDASNHPVARPGRLPGIFRQSGPVQKWAPMHHNAPVNIIYIYHIYISFHIFDISVSYLYTSNIIFLVKP